MILLIYIDFFFFFFSHQNKEIVWDASRSFPPVRSCFFSHGMTGITFLGDPSVGTGLPRGTMVYAAQPIPSQVNFNVCNSYCKIY